MRDKINLEKYIAVTCNKEEEFRNKWKFFCLYKIVLYPFFQFLYSDLFLFVTYLFNDQKIITLYSVSNKNKFLISDLTNYHENNNIVNKSAVIND